jgi:class 3 adenylate cyclase
VTTRLGSFLAVRWPGFAEFAADASVAGIESKLGTFGTACDEEASQAGGDLLDNPVKDTGESRLYSFQSSSAALAAALGLRRRLEAAGYPVAVGLHAGECQEHGDTWIGVAVREARALVDVTEAGETLVTEVFRLTLPDSRPELTRDDVPRDLAGNAWSVYRLALHEGGE